MLNSTIICVKDTGLLNPLIDKQRFESTMVQIDCLVYLINDLAVDDKTINSSSFLKLIFGFSAIIPASADALQNSQF